MLKPGAPKSKTGPLKDQIIFNNKTNRPLPH